MRLREENGLAPGCIGGSETHTTPFEGASMLSFVTLTFAQGVSSTLSLLEQMQSRKTTFYCFTYRVRIITVTGGC